MSDRCDVTVIGGGWSVQKVRPILARSPGTIIAVNDAALHAPWDHVVSMDRLWAENRIDQLTNRVPSGIGYRGIWLRRSAVQNFTAEQLSRTPVEVFDCDHKSAEFSDDPYHLNGPNSGHCALNLAWQILESLPGKRRLFLLGFDMNRSPAGEAYWYQPYPWVKSDRGATGQGKYDEWARAMETAAQHFRDIKAEVWNVSETSAIKAFRKMPIRDFLKELV